MAEHDGNGGSKGFFHTLPGIITGIAGLITAVGGFLLILNKLGCMEAKTSKATETEVQKSAEDIAATHTDTEATKITPKKNAEVSGAKTLVTYSPAETKNFTSKLTFRITEASVQPATGNELRLNVKIKCLNESTYNYYFYPAYIRVKIGEDKYGPDPSSATIDRTIIDSHSFKNLEYNFKIPGGIDELQLLIFDDYTTTDPITIQLK